MVKKKTPRKATIRCVEFISIARRTYMNDKNIAKTILSTLFSHRLSVIAHTYFITSARGCCPYSPRPNLMSLSIFHMKKYFLVPVLGPPQLQDGFLQSRKCSLSLCRHQFLHEESLEGNLI